MDKAKILRQCNEIERAVNELYVKRQDSITSDERIALINMLGVIVAEISAPPKTNADRIRQMTDEELIDLVNSSVCHYATNCLDNDCEECGRKWVMKEVSDGVTD